MKWQLRKPTLIESLVLIAIIPVVVALVLPGVEWASSGDIQVPVHVLVVDAVHGRPIANARVGIFRAPPLYLKFLEETPDQYDPTNRVRDDNRGATDADGSVVINYEFRTGASHKQPTTRAHLAWAWVHVQADGYGGVVIPVRYDSEPTATLRKQKELRVSIGLIPVEE